jgi:biopolymer transport protein ExbD
MADRFLDDSRPISDLNTTPLIDVLLVLLVMFIITIPMQTHKVAIELPTGVPKTLQPDAVRNVITIDAGNIIRWNGTAVTQPELRTLLGRSMRLSIEPALDLLPAAEARYALVDAVFADIRRARVTKLGLPGNAAYGAMF